MNADGGLRNAAGRPNRRRARRDLEAAAIAALLAVCLAGNAALLGYVLLAILQ